MSRAAKTILAFGVYVLLTGAFLAAMPDAVLAVFGFAPSPEIWVRVLGMQIAIVGFYYCAAAVGEARAFFHATLYGRVVMAIFVTLLVVLHMAGPRLLLFGLAELAGAAATALALNADARAGMHGGMRRRTRQRDYMLR